MHNPQVFQISAWLNEQLVSGESLKNVRKTRNKEHYFKKDVPVCDVEHYQSLGWSVYKETKKNRVTLSKEKPQSTRFEDRVWRLFALMGFTFLNAGEQCKIPSKEPYDKSNLKPKECHQIDVLAIDEDCAFFVECKSAENEKKVKNFRNDIEKIKANHGHYCRAVASTCDAFSSLKFNSIFVTQRYVVSSGDLQLMKDSNISYLNEDDILYYEQLAEQIGSAAKYQFCAHIFKNQEIKGMNNQVPAIRGKMGGHHYYSFSIEPERLLKMSFIAHRRKGDSSDSETYQRLIKKSRLQSVKAFVDNGNYFPNSIIVNVANERSSGRCVELNFKPSRDQARDTESKLGVLELPQKYGCAFVIDGQHRLYGYADSKYAKTNTIPVVLFENLSSEEQIKLFMDINENQKSVPKELKNTLFYILNADSKDPRKRQDALMLRIATDLGTKPDSPLYNYVKLLEHDISTTKQITTTAIHDGLNDGCLFNKYTSQKKTLNVTKYGLFYHGDMDIMWRSAYDFIVTCFKYICENCKDEWELGKGSSENPGILTINPAIRAILRVLSDIASTVIKKYSLAPLLQKEEFYDKVLYYLEPLVRFLNTITVEQKQELRTHLGAGAPEYYAMTFRHAIYVVHKDLDIDVQAMTQYFEDESRKYNGESLEIISKLRPTVRAFLVNLMKSEFPDTEEYLGAMPDKVYKQLNTLLFDYKTKNKEDKSASVVDMMDFGHFTKILSYYSAETIKQYTGASKMSVARIKEALSFIEKLSVMNFTRDSVKVAQFEKLKTYYNELKQVFTTSG